jgi:hypothetical protein
MLSQSRRSRPIAIALAFVCLIAGCVPELVLWLPDSSGLLFTDKDGSRVVHFDLKRNAKRIVVADTGTNTPWPAIRVDGTQFAVAKCELKYTKGSTAHTITTQIQIYDMSGDLLKTSEPHTRTEENNRATANETTVAEMALNWSGPKTKILTPSAIYDCSNDTWSNLDGIMPFPLENSPVRPDGKGFLATTAGGASEEQKLCFVDWDGWISEFKPPAKFTYAAINFYAAIDFQWKDAIAVLTFADAIYEFDSVTMKTTKTATSAAVIGDLTQLSMIHSFPGGQFQICCFHDRDERTWRLELQEPKKGRRKVLMSNSDYPEPPSWFSSPSPDGKKLAVTMMSSKYGSDRSKIIVLDGSGKIIASVDTE